MSVRRPIAIALLVAAGAAIAPAAQVDRSGVAEREAELGRIRQQISTLDTELDELAVRAYGIQGEIERVALERRLQERRVAEAEAELALAEQRVENASGRVAALEGRLAAERDRLEERLAGLYHVARHGHARLVFALEPTADPLSAIRLLRYLARRDAQSIARFETLRGRLEEERAGLEARRDEAASWAAQQVERRDSLRRLELRQRALLAGTRRDTERLAVQALELADRESHLAALLDALYGRSDTPLSGRSMQEFRGLLDWPVGGRMVVGFGPRRDPRYKTVVPHNGVELETVAGREVRVVYPGKVVFAAPFEGYGPTVVVQHAGRVFTLYAGLSAITVKRDDLLSLRQSLGRAGERLYFEIRVENRPEDPRRWIR